MRPAPSLEMSLINMPMRDPAANEERRIIAPTRHTFFKSELSSSSVFRVEGLPLHRTFPRHYFLWPQTAQKWEQRTGAPALGVSKQSARSFPTRRRVPEAPESQRSLEHQGSALLLRTTVTMFRLPEREDSRVLLYTSPHLQKRIHQISQWPLPASLACGHHLMGRAHRSTGVPTSINLSTSFNVSTHMSISTWCTHTHQCIHKPQCICTPQQIYTHQHIHTHQCTHMRRCIHMPQCSHMHKCNPHLSM